MSVFGRPTPASGPVSRKKSHLPMGAKARPIEVGRLRRAGKGHHIGEGLLPARSLDRHRLMLVQDLMQRDLFRAGLSSLLQLKYTAERDWLAAIPIRAVLTTCVFTAHPRTTIQEAVTIMLDKKIGCLPVVEDDRLVGLLSESDCLRYLAHLLEVAAEKDVLPELPPG